MVKLGQALPTGSAQVNLNNIGRTLYYLSSGRVELGLNKVGLFSYWHPVIKSAAGNPM
jgi:hypothetical protein